jgi:hypothetical protein
MRLSVQRRGAVVVVTAVLLAASCGGGTPLRMNDYTSFSIGQSLWHFRQQMLLVVAVPAFNQPVRIRAVELRPVHRSGQFDRSEAYLLAYSGTLYYTGGHLTYSLARSAIAGSTRERIDSRQVQGLDNQLSLVIPVNTSESGCHQAQVVLHVTTRDGGAHALPTRWYVSIDTDVSKVKGDDACAGPEPQPTASEPG